MHSARRARACVEKQLPCTGSTRKARKKLRRSPAPVRAGQAAYVSECTCVRVYIYTKRRKVRVRKGSTGLNRLQMIATWAGQAGQGVIHRPSHAMAKPLNPGNWLDSGLQNH
eukprot:6188625-Pleurochrysis_carterae.AAC.1